jgi:hypothetical protein
MRRGIEWANITQFLNTVLLDHPIGRHLQRQWNS